MRAIPSVIIAVLIAFGIMAIPSLGNQGAMNASTTQLDSGDCKVTYYGKRIGPLGCYGSNSLCKEESGDCDEIVE